MTKETITAEQLIESIDKNHPEKEKKKLIDMSKISLWIDHYNDIFSDFDPRPYSQRALSDDFLSEARKASRDKPFGTLDLNFLVPKDKRKFEKEMIIKKRLRSHFKKHLEISKKEFKKPLIQGILFCVFGTILMFLAALILFKIGERDFLIYFLIILLEPAGWFLFWEGLGLIIFESKKKKPTLDFYEKMSKCRINFLSY